MSQSAKNRKATDLSVQEHETKYRLLVDHCSELMWNMSPEGRFLDLSASWERITGYKPSSLIGTSFVPTVHPDDVPACFEYLRKVISSREVFQSPEYRARHADGTWHWHIATCTPVTGPDGNCTSVVGVSRDITERKETEKRLRESEEKFRKVFHTNQDSISINRLVDGTYMLINEGFKKLTGYTEADVIGRTSFDINIWENQEDRTRLIEGLSRDWKVENLDAKFRKKDGSIGYGIMSASLVDLDGIPHILSVTRDITDRKRDEQKLQESERKYRTLVENAAEAIFIAQDDRLKFINDEAVKIIGYSKEEVTSRPFINFIHPDDRALVLSRYIERQKGSKVPSRYAFRIIDSFGGTLWVELNAVVTEWGGKPAVLNFVNDITTRKRAEEELERARDFIQNVEDACFELDLEGNLIFCNEAFLNAMGYTYNELMALSPLDRHPTREEARRVFKIYNKVFRTGIPAESVEYQNLRKDGVIRFSEVSISLIRDKSGSPTGFRCIGRNITARRRQEEERRQLEERLQRAEKMEALGTLAGGVAHDLNNVMGIVLGYAELLLLSVKKASPLWPNLHNIAEAGQRAAAIVQDLLTLTRRGVSNRQVLNLNKIVSDSQNAPEFKKLCTYHPAVEIETQLESDLLNISGSPVHLSKTLFNLISNGSEAMPNGGKVTIRTANQYLDRPVQGYDQIREGDYVVLTVSDTGEGISPSDLKRIFEPFYTKKMMGRSGTGLGLAVVWGTIKDHNGYINVQSEKGRGSSFSLFFPVTREELTPENVPTSISEYMGRGESILVVDDVKGQRDLAASILRKLNYRVACVSSGEEAFTYLKEHPADLIVLDMIMDPGMDGLDTYTQILELYPKQKAIIVSGFSESERVRAAQDLGAGAYIRKPYVIEKLGLTLKAELDRK